MKKHLKSREYISDSRFTCIATKLNNEYTRNMNE